MIIFLVAEMAFDKFSTDFFYLQKKMQTIKIIEMFANTCGCTPVHTYIHQALKPAHQIGKR